MIKKTFFLLLIFYGSGLCGKIIETETILSIFNYLDPSEYGNKTLIVLDIDNTIAETYPTELGGDQWFFAKVEHYLNGGYAYYDAVKAVIPLYETLQNQTKMVLIEPCIIDLLQNLKKNNIIVIALTARPITLLGRVIQQLKEIGIVFEDFADISITNYHHDYYGLQNGIIASGVLGNKKGEVLFEMLEYLNYKPEVLIYIDDKITNVINVVDESEKRKIPKIIGIRYSRLDEKVRRFTLNF